MDDKVPYESYGVYIEAYLMHITALFCKTVLTNDRTVGIMLMSDIKYAYAAGGSSWKREIQGMRY